MAQAMGLAAGEVQLYWFDCEPPDGSAEELRQLLQPEERERAARFHFPEHRRRFTGAHAGLRIILGRLLGVPPQTARFEFGTNGKPSLPGLPLHFNLSHSGRYALVGTCLNCELGVDLEAERPGVDLLGLAKRFFTPAETLWLEELPEAERRHGFFRLWTCKEAWLKVDGRGMALPLNRIQVTFAPDGPELRATEPPFPIWFVQEFQLIPGFCAAVVLAAVPAKIKVQELDLRV